MTVLEEIIKVVKKPAFCVCWVKQADIWLENLISIWEAAHILYVVFSSNGKHKALGLPPWHWLLRALLPELGCTATLHSLYKMSRPVSHPQGFWSNWSKVELFHQLLSTPGQLAICTVFYQRPGRFDWSGLCAELNSAQHSLLCRKVAVPLYALIHFPLASFLSSHWGGKWLPQQQQQPWLIITEKTKERTGLPPGYFSIED